MLFNEYSIFTDNEIDYTVARTLEPCKDSNWLPLYECKMSSSGQKEEIGGIALRLQKW